MKIDPSSTQPDYSAMDAAPATPGGKAKKTPTKTVYPDLTLRGDAADAIIADHQAGETFEADVTFKVTAIHSRKGGTAGYSANDEQSSVELEIISIDKEGAENPDEEDAESAVDAYRSKMSSGAGEGDEEED